MKNYKEKLRAIVFYILSIPTYVLIFLFAILLMTFAFLPLSFKNRSFKLGWRDCADAVNDIINVLL